MSLLNKMLADLETRAAEAQQPSAAAPVLAGLRAVEDERRASGPRWIIWMVLLAAALVFAGMRLYPLVQARWQQHEAATHTAAHALGRDSSKTTSAAAQNDLPASAPNIEQVERAESATSEVAATSEHVAIADVEAVPAPRELEAITANETENAQAMAPPTEAEPSASDAADRFLDAERAMAPTDFVAMALPPLTQSVEISEEPALSDPLQPAPANTLQDSPAPVEGKPVTEVTVVQPAAFASEEPLGVAPEAAGMAPVVVEMPPQLAAAPDVPVRSVPDGATSPPLTPTVKTAAKGPSAAAIVKAPQRLSPEDDAQEAYLTGLQRVGEGRLTEAEANFRDSLRFHPAQLDARVALASLLRDQERVQEAQSLLEDGLAVLPGAGVLRQWLARLYLEQGFTERAVAVLESGRSFAEEDGDYLAVLAAFYQQAGSFNAAAEAYRQALRRDPQQGRWWMGLGLALESDGQPVLAAQAYERALGTSGLPRELVPFTRARLAAARQDVR